MQFFADGEMPTGKNLLVNIFFLVPSMTGNFYSIFFLTCIGRFVGIFELIDIYLGIEKLF